MRNRTLCLSQHRTLCARHAASVAYRRQAEAAAVVADDVSRRMLITGNFDAHARKLVDPQLPVAQRAALVTEMRDSIEIVHTSEYG